MTTDKIISHNFFQQLLKDVEPFLKDAKIADVELINKDVIPEIEYYIQNVNFYAIHLFELCKQLERAVELLSNFRFNSKNGISRGEHLTYNVENYIIRLTSLTDRILQTVNAVFHLGINEKDINERVIINNLKITMTSLPASFNEFRKVLQNYVSERNVIVHRHSYIKKELYVIEMLYHPLMTKETSINKDEAENLNQIRKETLSYYLSKIKKEFKQTNEKCFEKLLLIFDDLDEQYSSMKLKLK
jgi:hypothetical protein